MSTDLVRRMRATTSSRREFLRAAMAAGLGASAIELLASEAMAQQVAGGHMRFGLAGGSTTDSLDPVTFVDTFMIMVGFAFRGNLTEIATDGSVKPEICESFEPADSGRKWIFKLRRGLLFSNGKAVTTDDIIKSINLHRAQNSKSSAKALLGSIVDIKPDGSDAIQFSLKDSDPDFPFLLSDFRLNIMPFDGDAYDLHIGAGPFLLKHLETGVRAELESNPNSYKSAHLASAELISVTETVARQLALISKRVDVINRPDLKTTAMLSKTPGLKVVDVPGRMHYSMPADCRVAPFDNLDVRLALKYAIDREAILRTVLQGHGSIGNDQPITPSYRYHLDSLKPKPYDPERARFHLKKAGLPDLKIDLSTSEAAFAGAVDTAILFASASAKAGITVNTIREPSDGYWDNVWMKKPFCMSYWGGRPTENLQLTIGYSTGADWNESHWSNEKFDAILAQVRMELDDSKRRVLYAELQQILSNEGSSIIPVFANYVHASTDKVVYPQQLSGVWEMDGARCLERWSLS